MTPEESIEQYKLLHVRRKEYGAGGQAFNMGRLNRFIQPGIRSILDYGCGKGDLVKRLQGQYIATGYDPAISAFQKIPNGTFDAVISFDVLEHFVQPFQNDLTKIAEKAKTQIILGISCRPAKAFLPNGLNAHTLVLEPHHWYKILNTRITGWYVSESFFQKRYLLVSMLRD
jgi:2-polyprenyl-3-methyl-5-hydroxy-6-metoxy-1,4-benzoquinol methylase